MHQSFGFLPRQPVGTLWILLCLGLVAQAAEEPASFAHKILEATGIQGGLIVHLGCGDGRLTSALHVDDGYVVHGLDTDRVKVEKARYTIRNAGLYGLVSADVLKGSVLPYTDNLVNLLVAEGLGRVTMDEVLRILVPHGVAYVRQGGKWIKTTKPRPREMDEWTHYLHNPSGNAVSQDRAVDFLRQMQWVGGPRYSRHHDHMSGASAMVSAGGRLFYIFDHASPFSIQLPSKWQLVARDAFNGTVLWHRNLESWFSQLQRLKSGPSNLPRRLVAIDDTVFVTLSLDAPVSVLDAATGQTRKVYPATKGADEILYLDGVLYLVVNRLGHARGPLKEWTAQERVLMAVDVDSGDVLWERTWPWVVPGCLAVEKTRAVFYDGERVVALNRKTGETQWQSDALGKPSPVPIYFSPCLVLYQDRVLFSGAEPETGPYHADNGKTMVALAADTGKAVWTSPHPPAGYRSAEDILVTQGLVWTSDIFNSREFRTEQTGKVWGRDPRTGEVKVAFMPDVTTHWFHHRCYRAKATEKYLLTSRTGIEFVDVAGQHWTCHHWVRGACLYGIMPANGMVYNPPHPCACYLEAKLYGYNALAPLSKQRALLIEAAERSDRLERGPAYRESVSMRALSNTDWPTLRANAARSGFIDTSVPLEPVVSWRTRIGGRLSSPVVADGRLYVAAIDTHSVHALNAQSGESLWRFTAGARVDSPPTIWQGRALFGSADGYVYCLRAEDGRLMWRYRVAPADMRMGAFGQIESVWPVHGSVLVRDNKSGQPELWCVAGRSMFLDGGLRLVRLNPSNGALLGEQILDDRLPQSEDNLQVALSGLNMPVALPDILVSQGDYVYMRSQQFDLDGRRIDLEAPNEQARRQKGPTAHLFSPTGLLDDIWWHRSYWVFGRVWKSGAGGYYQSGRFAPAGRPMVYNDKWVYSFGRKPEYYRWTTPMEYQLYAANKQPKVIGLGPQGKGKRRKGGLGSKPLQTIQTEWQRDLPLLARAMVLAGNTLFVAGPPDLIDEPKTLTTFDTSATQALLAKQADVLEGKQGAVLWTVSAEDGTKLAQQSLRELPVFDGLIAADHHLFYTSTDGHVIALGEW